MITNAVLSILGREQGSHNIVATQVNGNICTAPAQIIIREGFS